MIYLDNNATTFLDPQIREELLLLLQTDLGNPSSIHHFGQKAKHLLYTSLKTVASHFGVRENEVFFTSGATEALNMALLGFTKKGHIITSTLEHAAVLEPILRLEKKGWPVTYLSPVEGRGAISLEQVEKAVSKETVLIVLMAANNETGVKTPLEPIASFAKEKGIFFLVDGVALLGKEPFDLPSGVSAICFSGHKMHGMLGAGVAILRKNYPFEPLIVGGPQQGGKRAGTENLIAIASFAKAIERLRDVASFSKKMKSLSTRFEEGILEALPDAKIHGLHEPRITNTSSICFPNTDGETLLILLDRHGIAASHGSACASGGLEPSKVLLKMGISPQEARATVRFSLSRFTTEKEIDEAVQIITKVVKSSS